MLCSKFRGPIKSITNYADYYDQKYMKIKFNTDDDLTLTNMLQLCNMIIIVRYVFHAEN